MLLGLRVIGSSVCRLPIVAEVARLRSAALPVRASRCYSSSSSSSSSSFSSSSSIPNRREKEQKEATTTLAKSIAKQHSLPLFSIPASEVHLIEQPSEFYTELLSIISRAKRRIFLASLYIGKTETDLISHLRRALDRETDLQVTVLVDSLRSTREGDYQGSSKTSSCASFLAGLQRDYPDRVFIRLYRAPGLPRWLEKLLGKRFVEGWGLQHMKIYGGDDEVMISGANLSNDYFTNRRDRYIRLRDQHFSRYAYNLLMLASRFSYSLSAVERSQEDKGGDEHAAYQLDWDEGKKLPMLIGGEHQGRKGWKKAMREEVIKLTEKHHSEYTGGKGEKVMSSDSIQVVPLLQMGPLQITQETTCVPLVIRAADTPASRLDFTTGYFSINPAYANLIVKGRFQSEMITASPRANGFYGSRGISGYLPAAYTWFESLFWATLQAQKRHEQVTVREWGKEGWTYHAKGIWLYPDDAKASPTLTLLGSSNFGTRSASLDLEFTLLIDASSSPSVQKRLKEEVVELRKNADDVVGEEMFAREERKVHWGVKVAAWFIKRML